MELLERMPIFSDIRPDTLECLLEEVRVRRVPTGDFFFRQGDQATFMYVLETGQVTVRKQWQGRELVLGSLTEGECFGEMALIDMTPRSASVRAERVCSAIEISSSDLYGVYEYDPNQFAIIQVNICRELCRRLRLTDQHLMQASASKGLAQDRLALAELLPM
ncbi:MAG: Crp/Fnr family transcriptional regulator [Leptothrix sp. (in: b-proteobacteria)]